MQEDRHYEVLRDLYPRIKNTLALAREKSNDPRLKVAAGVFDIEGYGITAFNYSELDTYTKKYDHGVDTHPSVLHAEENLIAEMVKQKINFQEKFVFVSTLPCIHCMKLLIRAGARCIIFENYHTKNESIDYVREFNSLEKNLNDQVFLYYATQLKDTKRQLCSISLVI